jgi:probable HAF family extracellular repeat protein
MKRVALLLLALCVTGFAQQYTVLDLGSFGGSTNAEAINSSGQVVGSSNDETGVNHWFRTAPNAVINPATDDLNWPNGMGGAIAINASGQVAGQVIGYDAPLWGVLWGIHSIRIGPTSLLTVNDVIDDAVPDGSRASGINDAGQVAGRMFWNGEQHVFRTAPNSPINPATDDVGLGAGASNPHGVNINNLGQVAGFAVADNSESFCFRTAPNSAFNPLTDILGSHCIPYAINTFGEVVGHLFVDNVLHAFRTGPNSPINLNTDDLGTFGGDSSLAFGINDAGQVVGWALAPNDVYGHAFLYDNGVKYDLNYLVPGVNLLNNAVGINNAGQLVINYIKDNGDGGVVLLTPVHHASVKPPINADGTSVFSVKRGVIPVKFSLAENGNPTCVLPDATIAITRVSGGTLGSVDEGTYLTFADGGSNFRIEQADCQYAYNISAPLLGVGTYRVTISIEGFTVGFASFALK